jgi:hypothetical protein
MTIKRTGTLGSIVAVASTMACAAHAADVDWKVYGHASLAGVEICFYDAMGMVRTPDGLVRVWTKCLSQQDLDAIDIKADFGGKILENTARKVARYYVPPIAAVEDIDVNQAMLVTQYEETANISSSGIKPHSTIFYEFNCPQKMLRELSMRFSVNGKSGFFNEPTDWKFISPEDRNGVSLLKILCPPR